MRDAMEIARGSLQVEHHIGPELGCIDNHSM
jgi:hypothetical protein